jgi:transcriptional regulator with GAF, ATPase, and Fis domain
VKTETLTQPQDGVEETTSVRIATRLVFLADVENPELASSSHALDEIDEVRFHRGDRSIERTGRVLKLGFPDARMSSDHGRLIRHDRRWVVDDPASKNGTLVDGAVARRTILGSTALLELGRTFLWFAHSQVDKVPSHLTGDVDASQLPAWPAGMTTFSPVLAQAFGNLVRLAALPVPILLLGETGTGKEVIAKAIHELSRRRGDLVAVNCGALPPTLLESELFGHRRGAFSGATADRRGLVRSADGGTLFLDEIGELPNASQVAFLRVLQEHQVLPVGDDRPVAVDLRVVAATLRDLTTAVDAGKFRTDLYARLAGHVVELLPLRDRREDLALLIATLHERIAGTPAIKIAAPALRMLVRHDWPRNIRELEQVLTSAIALATERIELEHLPESLRTPRVAAAPQPRLLDDDDRELRERLVALLAEHEGNVFAVAEVLGKQRQQIYKWIKRLAIDLTEFRQG